MDKTEFKKVWKHLVVDIGKSETTIAIELGKTQQALNQSINNASIRFVDFVNILEKYGYTFEIKKKSE